MQNRFVKLCLRHHRIRLYMKSSRLEPCNTRKQTARRQDHSIVFDRELELLTCCRRRFCFLVDAPSLQNLRISD